MKLKKEELLKLIKSQKALISGICGAIALLLIVVCIALADNGNERVNENKLLEDENQVVDQAEMESIGAQEDIDYDMSLQTGFEFGIIYDDESELLTEEPTTEEPTTEEPTTEPAPDIFIVNDKVKEYINVRKGPGTDTDIIGKLYVSAGGIVVEEGDQWTKIESGNVTGYVYNKYIFIGEEAEEYAWLVCDITAKSTVNSLRIRGGDSTDDKIISVINKGTKVEVKEKGDEWSEVIYGKYRGYCSNKYLEFKYTMNKAMTLEEEAKWKAEEEAKRKAAEEEARRKAAEEKAALEAAIKKSSFSETIKTSPYNLSEEDAYMLACLVCAEAGYETHEGKLAVANVVLNRLNGGYYGDSIRDVIYAKNQFSVVASGRFSKVIKSGPNAESIKAAKEAISGVNNVSRYASFCALYVANFKKYAEYTIIGNQVFYRRK